MKKLVSIILPAYNESGAVSAVASAIEAVMVSDLYDYRIVFVDDGSADDTLEHIKRLASAPDSRVCYISLSRNFGQQSAIKAGYEMAQGDCVITMDCDMQHPPELIPDLLRLWENGYQVVYTVRKEDKRLPWFKRTTSKLFYRIQNALSDVSLEAGMADFRLMDRKVIDTVNSMPERGPFIRGQVKWVGFRQIGVEYMPNERVAGQTKYTFRKMCALALRGITSNSVKPLYAAIWLGGLIALLCVLYLPYVIYSVATGHVAAGWSSLILTVAFLGALQLIMLGILGVYIGKVVEQTRHRPDYIVDQTNLTIPAKE